jgi:hypothetical protein
MLPDDGTCLPLPAAARSPREPPGEEAAGIELLPERPPDYTFYRLPVGLERAEPRPDGVLLHEAPGTPVTAPALEDQDGPAELRRDPAPELRLVSLHTVRRATAVRRYLVVLDPVRVELPTTERTLAPGARVGRILPGSHGSILLLTVRQLRQATDSSTLSAAELLENAHSSPCDPPNVLQRKAPSPQTRNAGLACARPAFPLANRAQRWLVLSNDEPWHDTYVTVFGRRPAPTKRSKRRSVAGQFATSSSLPISWSSVWAT